MKAFSADRNYTIDRRGSKISFQRVRSPENPKSAKLPKSHFWEGEVGDQLPTVEAESKFAEIPKFHFQAGGGGGLEPTSNFWYWVQICFNPEVQFPGGSGLNFKLMKLSPQFDNIRKSHFQRGRDNF